MRWFRRSSRGAEQAFPDSSELLLALDAGSISWSIAIGEIRDAFIAAETVEQRVKVADALVDAGDALVARRERAVRDGRIDYFYAPDEVSVLYGLALKHCPESDRARMASAELERKTARPMRHVRPRTSPVASCDQCGAMKPYESLSTWRDIKGSHALCLECRIAADERAIGGESYRAAMNHFRSRAITRHVSPEHDDFEKDDEAALHQKDPDDWGEYQPEPPYWVPDDEPDDREECPRCGRMDKADRFEEIQARGDHAPLVEVCDDCASAARNAERGFWAWYWRQRR